MKYFNGFALDNEEHFFGEWIKENDYTLSGFSYGAILAFKQLLNSESRIDTLQLFSPAFFQEKEKKFKRLQLMGYKKSSKQYVETFTKNCFLPYSVETVTHKEHNIEALEELLSFVWSEEALKAVTNKGVKIEVYLGSEDHISDVEAAYAFFKPFATVTLIKGANHFLQGKKL